MLVLALRLWLLSGCTDSARQKEPVSIGQEPRQGSCPPSSVLPRLLSTQTYLDRPSASGCPPRRGVPASGPPLGRNVQEKCARRQRGRSGSLLPGLLSTGVGVELDPAGPRSLSPLKVPPSQEAEEPTQYPPLCENSTSPLSSWACVKRWTSVSGATLKAIRPLLGCSTV